MSSTREQPTESAGPKPPQPPQPVKAKVTVTYNGVDKVVTYEPRASMQSLLDASLNAFGITANRHLMALWTKASAELPIEGSIEKAGVKPGDLLILRPSAVRGG